MRNTEFLPRSEVLHFLPLTDTPNSRLERVACTYCPILQFHHYGAFLVTRFHRLLNDSCKHSLVPNRNFQLHKLLHLFCR